MEVRAQRQNTLHPVCVIFGGRSCRHSRLQTSRPWVQIKGFFIFHFTSLEMSLSCVLFTFSTECCVLLRLIVDSSCFDVIHQWLSLSGGYVVLFRLNGGDVTMPTIACSIKAVLV